jgi:anti-sigma28 factor (negative regulator of flagellin synthesis)
MSNQIVNAIARLMAQRELSPKDSKDSKELKSKKDLSAPSDTVTFTSAAQTYAAAGTGASEYEKEQFMKVERLKALVSEGNYKMDETVVSTIAERIANSLL